MKVFRFLKLKINLIVSFVFFRAFRFLKLKIDLESFGGRQYPKDQTKIFFSQNIPPPIENKKPSSLAQHHGGRPQAGPAERIYRNFTITKNLLQKVNKLFTNIFSRNYE